MARCAICGKGTMHGRNIRHKHAGRWERRAPKTNRVFRANIHKRMVRYMLVPVSPSGTGKTLIALIASTWRSSQAVAVANIARNSLPDSVLSTDELVMERLWGRASSLS